MRSPHDVTDAIVGAMVVASDERGGIDVTAQKSDVQYLRDVLDGETSQSFEGSGCSDHVTRRNLLLTVAGALLGLLVLIAILVA